MHPKKLFFALALSGFALLQAQGGLKKTLLERIIEPRLSLESAYLSAAKVKGTQSGLSVAKNSIKINNEIVGISYTNWTFNWDTVSALPFGDGIHAPIEQMHSVKVNLNLPYRVNEKWFLLTSLSANSTFEKETSGSYGAGLFSFASYAINKDHTLQLGAFANYHPIRTLALPVVSYSYRSRQRDGLQAVLGFPRSYLGYHQNSALLYRLGMLFSQSVIKLGESSTLSRSGYIEAKDYMANVGITYDISSHFNLQTDLLYSLKRNFTLYDAGGVQLQKHAIEPSLGANIKLIYLF